MPAGISGYTFLDLSRTQTGYFGKTTITKDVAKGFGLRGQVVHANEPVTRSGAGITYTLPMPGFLKGNVFAKVNYMPLWSSNSTGKRIENKSTVGYYASVELPKNFSFMSFADINLEAKGGVQWEYGEAEISKKLETPIGTFNIGYNAALQNNGAGNPRPTIENRLVVRTGF